MANRIARALELKNGGNQSEMARYIGVSPQAVQKWVAGGAEPKGKNLTKAAEFLGVTPSYLKFGILTTNYDKTLQEALSEPHHKSLPVFRMHGEVAVEDNDRRLGPDDRRAREGEIVIPQYKELGGSMGAGLLLRDQPGEIHRWSVTQEWIAKNVKNHTGAGNLRIVTGFGDSMRPLYNPGDPLLVDAGVKSVDFDSIYFFRIGEEGFIKRLQRVPGQGLLAISENKSYRDWVITPEMDFEVFARVIKVWCGSDF